MELVIKKKVWIEYKGQPIMSIGRYSLLKKIGQTSSIKRSAKLVGICEKTAHNHISKMESRLGRKLVASKKGGRDGGGSAHLTPLAIELMNRFERAR